MVSPPADVTSITNWSPKGLVADHGDGGYAVAAMTLPPMQTVDGAVNRLDALEASVNETLVAIRTLRSDLAGVQTPCCGQWWLVGSLAKGADPAAVDTSHAVSIRDRESGELHWLACTSDTYFQPLLTEHPDHTWTARYPGADWTVTGATEADARA